MAENSDDETEKIEILRGKQRALQKVVRCALGQCTYGVALSWNDGRSVRAQLIRPRKERREEMKGESSSDE